MASERIPINREMIKWSRERAGFSVEAIATGQLKNIAAWEAGDASPTYRQLEHLADKVSIPVAAFFFPEIPDVPDIKESFRTIPDAEFASLPPTVVGKLRRAKAFQLNLALLYDSRNPSRRPLWREISVNPSDSAIEVAAAVRLALGISERQVFDIQGPEEALRYWRELLEAAGVFTFKDAFSDDRFAGFCIYDDEFPVIFVNNSVPKTRQIFTLFHELAHILREISGLDPVDRSISTHFGERAREVEIWCNRFASEFVLPEKTFSEEAALRPYTEAAAEEIADLFCVSREVVFRRFLDRGWISQAAYEEAAERWRAQRTQRAKGGNAYRTRIAYLGHQYITRAFQLFYSQRLSEVELAEVLNTKPKHLAKLESYIAEGSG